MFRKSCSTFVWQFQAVGPSLTQEFRRIWGDLFEGDLFEELGCRKQTFIGLDLWFLFLVCARGGARELVGGCRHPDPPPYSWGAPAPRTPCLGGLRPPDPPRGGFGGRHPPILGGLGCGSPPGIRLGVGRRQPPRERRSDGATPSGQSDSQFRLQFSWSNGECSQNGFRIGLPS